MCMPAEQENTHLKLVLLLRCSPLQLVCHMLMFDCGIQVTYPKIECLQHLKVCHILLQLLSPRLDLGQLVALPSHVTIQLLPFLREAAKLGEEEPLSITMSSC